MKRKFLAVVLLSLAILPTARAQYDVTLAYPVPTLFGSGGFWARDLDGGPHARMDRWSLLKSLCGRKYDRFTPGLRTVETLPSEYTVPSPEPIAPPVAPGIPAPVKE